MQTVTNNSSTLSSGLEFILSHFEEPVFPRTISTSRTQNKQVEIFGRENALNLYQYSGAVDCKINAYPSYTDWNGINRQAPSFIFIDLDKSTFRNERAHALALKKTLKNLKERLAGAEPTVLLSGNGYHVYQPVEATVLEEYEIFSDFDHPSKTFLKFAEQYFSNGKSDPAHTPTFKSCMIRIPGSHNSKCISKNNGTADSSTETKTIQKWNSFRPRINLVLAEFHAYLVQEKLIEIKRQRQATKYRQEHAASIHLEGDYAAACTPWIEKLLDTPITDFRKNAIGLILAPYLINIRKYPYGQTYATIKEWLDKCDAARRLDSKFDWLVKYAIQNAMKTGYRPLKSETLKIKNEHLYNLLFWT